MTEERKKYRIFLSAAEPSADLHCAELIKALKKRGDDFEFVGVGGAKMAEAGCELIENTAQKAVMIYNAFAHILRFQQIIGRIKSYLKKNRCDIVVVCDSPAFNFHVAKAAKKAGAMTLFYVAPQLWAWAPWRINKLRKCCDKLCCILPFEQEWFRKRGVDAVFGGNPLLDGLGSELEGCKKTYDYFDISRAKIALMPGSRPAEIATLWEPMQRIIGRLRHKYPKIEVTCVAVDEERKEILKSTQIIGFRCKYSIDSVRETAKESDFCLVASGSATLQVAGAGCPMAVMYQSNKVLWHLVGRWLITTKFLSLVNILAQKELVPEFMPYFASYEPISGTVGKMLGDKNALSALSSELIELAKPMACQSASQNASALILEMLEQKRDSAQTPSNQA